MRNKLLFFGAAIAGFTVVMVLAVYLHCGRRNRETCRANLYKVRSEMQKYVTGHSIAFQMPVNLEEVGRYAGEALPVCPSGGTYLTSIWLWGPVCSIHGDLLSPAQKASPAAACAAAMAGVRSLLAHYQNWDAISLEFYDSGIRYLGIHDSRFSDGNLLKGCMVTALDIRHTSVTDVTPLANIELHALDFDPLRTTKGIDSLRRMKSLQKINGLGVVEFWSMYDAGKFRSR